MESATTPARVGIRALRDGLSAQLHRVKDGETIEVTEHGRVIARIVPVEAPSAFERLVAQGLIEPAATPLLDLPEPIRGTDGASDLIPAQRR
ncbi:type II toxin-antitoxin system Phd/YefM family antitoxin [Agrococcus lahaulensis]|uniref:type II toxin-antitoxin system Phd/YefM family antitoxin n=1 Tax=Agrococcus lahaulensis TaxID=341722 RepID=UPI00047ABA9C|nr:type II toxin-antitoxin system prevent-host-death family antitoxin [Agrococcus lahaulensis]